jgi:type IV pilus assembly protein PilZ
MSESWNPPAPTGAFPDPAGDERRSSQRFAVEWAVDCVGEETFLYAEITNVSQLGIFVACQRPFEVGTALTLKFSPDGQTFSLPGRVQWVNRSHGFASSKHPGMGICFSDLSPEDRERLVEIIHTIAYLRSCSN